MPSVTLRTIRLRNIPLIILCVVSTLFSVYVGFNAYFIASVGVTSQVPQLEGDGGGGVVVAALCLIGGGLCCLRAWLGAVVYALAAATAALAGLVFQDPVTFLWGIGPVLFGACAVFIGRKRVSRSRLGVINRTPGYPQTKS